MGEAEITSGNNIVIRSHIITYGNAADEVVTERIRDEIETMWNEPKGTVNIHNTSFQILFRITAETRKDISELEVLQNTDPRINYFRIEEYVNGNISFVDAIGCNTGHFKLENLYVGSTTAAHEYGHTLGLDHPLNTDLRGKGVPGIMYPRGTLVDPEFQYDPSKPAGATGGTMHPMYRKVSQQDIELIKLNRLSFIDGKAIVGEFTNVYHWPHQS
ncbi:MAG: peptidase M10 [Flavisolibacter sp.]